jgi:hypothetical protein
MVAMSTSRLLFSKMPSVQQTAGQHECDPATKRLKSNSFRIGHLRAFSFVPELIKRGHKPMFRITRETLRRFSLREVLLLAAMNLETSSLASENHVRLALST